MKQNKKEEYVAKLQAAMLNAKFDNGPGCCQDTNKLVVASVEQEMRRIDLGKKPTTAKIFKQRVFGQQI
ncbi:MAG TPA: hypothetical protein VGF14_06675 [Alphaproteobacteria bacterium]